MTFWLSAPQEEPVPLPVGTEVATLRTESEEAVVFATERELSVVPCELRYLVTQRPGEPVADRTADLAEGKDVMCFAESPRPGDCMLFGLTAAVPYCAIVLELDSRRRRRRRGPAAAAAGLGGVDRGRLDGVRGRP